ncbi:hypothetical protein E4U42_000546 [Claviceps africana]|uniref:GH16 domain-containing protein n=1 Tax=Claviceps africana TaxID=83212 RepID=A0A8K0NHR6_9HYPO|nr:hypothetical protein E4U42_000546 [Claviceps africana]
MHWIWGIVLSLASPIACEACTCGYVLTDDADKSAPPVVFTDSLVTDFGLLSDISRATDWTRQQFNVSAEAGRGTHGKSFRVENVFSYTGPNLAEHQDVDGGFRSQRAMGLRVGSILTEMGAIAAAEIDSARMDMFWGSYRVTMKLTRTSGTCAAFFWRILSEGQYRNDSQEIDMEFLSREFDVAAKIFPVNLVMHSRDSMRDGYDASKSGTLRRVELPFDPTSDFHEYRFDYLPGRVTFHADDHVLAEMRGERVPSSGGHLILQHWSNGNTLWSGGPPASDAVVLVRSVKAYFNSSVAHKDAISNWNDACNSGEKREETCQVPDKASQDSRSSDDSTGDRGHGNNNGPTTQEDSQGYHGMMAPTTTRLALLLMSGALLSSM